MHVLQPEKKLPNWIEIRESLVLEEGTLSSSSGLERRVALHVIAVNCTSVGNFGGEGFCVDTCKAFCPGGTEPQTAPRRFTLVNLTSDGLRR